MKKILHFLIIFSYRLIFCQLFISMQLKLNLINYLLINKISNLIFENKILNEKKNFAYNTSILIVPLLIFCTF